MKQILFLFSVLLLVSCASVPDAVVQDKGSISSSLGVNESEIFYVDSVVFTVLPSHQNYARFELGVFVLTQTTVHVLRYSDDNKNLYPEVAIPHSSLGYAGVATRGAFKHLQQLRLQAGNAVVALNFASSISAEAGYKERTQKAVSALKALGISASHDAPWVLPNVAKEWRLSTPLIINPS
jgi:hypothetical protein